MINGSGGENEGPEAVEMRGLVRWKEVDGRQGRINDSRAALAQSQDRQTSSPWNNNALPALALHQGKEAGRYPHQTIRAGHHHEYKMKPPR